MVREYYVVKSLPYIRLTLLFSAAVRLIHFKLGGVSTVLKTNSYYTKIPEQLHTTLKHFYHFGSHKKNCNPQSAHYTHTHTHTILLLPSFQIILLARIRHIYGMFKL